MKEKTIPLTNNFQVENTAHILYFFNDLESYIANAIAYILAGLEYGHHILLVENNSICAVIDRKLDEIVTPEVKELVHYIDNYDFYGIKGDFHHVTIVDYFGKILQPFLKNEVSIRTWAHVEWEDQSEIVKKIEEFEYIADRSVVGMKLMSVCAYDALTSPASLQTILMRSHAYYMTDHELMKSPLYHENGK